MTFFFEKWLWRHTMWTVRSGQRVCSNLSHTQPKSHCHFYATNFTRTSCTYKHRHTCMRYESAPVQTIKWTIKLDLRGYKWPFILHPLYASHALFFTSSLFLSLCVSFVVDDRTLSAAAKTYIYLFVSVSVMQREPCTFRKCWKLDGTQKYAKGRINIAVDIFIDCGLFAASCKFEYLLNAMRHRAIEKAAQINQFDISVNQRKKFK